MVEHVHFKEMLGGCRCGQLRYRVTGAPKFIMACHCTDCQQLTSSAFSLAMVMDEAQVETTAGIPHEWAKTGSSGKLSWQFTCRVCAGWIYTRPESQPGKMVVRPSTLDDHRWVTPIAQIFTRSALPWARMPLQFSYETEFEDASVLVEAFALGGVHP